ncbi:ribonuclease P protein component [Telmatobacter sp. DSM 110680]|uniref:Ribonuclease P protein component n=1 Tax=Telmatobacter sp. DSM 110680 TaxID=3036704 RepID=A0AAU7DHM7_9BACT
MSISSKPELQILAPAPRKVRQSLAAARLRKHADFQRAYAAAGRKRRSASMSWFLAPQDEPSGSRVGLTVGKVIGKAHERNRIKRRLRDILRRHVELLPIGCDLILHPHRTVLTIEFTKLEAEILRILQQANAEQARANLTVPRRSRNAESVS